MARRSFRGLTAAAIVAVSGIVFVGPAWAVCASLPAGLVTTPPSDLLAKYPSGGPALSSDVRNLVASNPEQLAAVVGLLPGATASQRSAIGAGLGQAAGVCTRPEPDTARRIQEAVVAAANPETLAAFQDVTGDRQTTAVGGPGGAAGGSIGGGGVQGSSTSGSSPSVYIPTSTLSYSNPGLTFSSGGGTFTGLAGSRTVTITSTPTTTVSQR